MPLNLYDFTIPIYIRAFINLDQQLIKASEWAQSNSILEADLVSSCLIADMNSLIFQVQAASKTAINTIPHITGSAPVPLEYNETTMADLHRRIAWMIEILKREKREDLEGKEDAEVSLMVGETEIALTGEQYVQRFALPNFLFHVVVAYAILRAKGVPLGKGDFLGEPWSR